VDYWQKRQEAMYKAGEMQVNQYFKRLEKVFNQTKRELQKTIEAFYFRYAEENGLSFAAAQKRLNAEELGELNDFIALAMDNIGKYNQQVNNMSLKARVTRYQALEMQVDAILRQLYAIDYQAESERTMQEVYEDTYYRTWYSIDQYHGFHQAFAQVEPRTVEKLLEYPFNGAAFSSRIWKQKDHLQTQLTEAVTTMLIQGKHPSTLTREFAKKMQSKKFDAYRLLHTESSFLISEATHAGYKEDGVEKYEILATLDSKTCEICGELDGNVYEVGKEITGVNMPPFHPLCRCTDVPHYADTPTNGMARVARDPETGKTYEVPADMTYKQWHEQYVEKNPDKRLAERKQRNKKADNEQFQRYRKILGKDAPETLDSFQTMKYTDSEKWNAKKREFATISKIMEKESYSEEYRSKMRSTYYRFKDKGYEFTDHSLNRYLGQKTGRGKKAFTEDELLKVLDSSVNYLEEGGRTVKFYNGIAAIQNEQTEEVVSIVVRNKPKKGWGSK
jgi:SPP1 gp7 family putative phage head morphogenesis protein